MIGKGRKSLLAVLICVFMLVFSLGIMSACGESNASTENGSTAEAQWHYGTTAPADDLGNVGDHYLDTESLRAYVRAANGQWEPTNLYSGSGAPENSNGTTGDLYLNTESGVLFQKESNGLWKVVLTVKGEKGRDGVMWFSGAQDPNTYPEGDPTLTDAQKGDFFLNTNGFSVWQLGVDGTWNELGAIKGDPGKDSVHFFDGEGAPEGKEATLEGLQDGDLYLGIFKGIETAGGGSRLYRYDAAKKEWKVLMDTVREDDINIHSLADFDTLTANIAKYDGYRGKVVHLKTDIKFSSETTRGRRAAQNAADWTPIGTSETPFRGTFDGEGHTVYNFSTEVSTDATKVGFFGNVEGATIQDLRFENVIVNAATADESSSVDAVGAVVVGQAQGETTVKNVTVKEATVQTAEETQAKVGGLVGKLKNSETEEETSLKVEGSSFEGTVQSTVEGTKPQSVDSLVADKDEVSEDKVTFTDSSVTDGEGNKSAWDESGKHYAEDTEGNLSYFVSSAQDITDLLSKAEGSVSVTLENDLTLNGSTVFNVNADLTVDVGGHKLSVTSGDNAGIQVEAGKSLTIKGTGAEQEVQLNSASKKPAISVNGTGATLNIEGANVDIKNQYAGNLDGSTENIVPAIIAENGASVNIGSGTTITAYGQGNGTSYKEPQIAAADGAGSIVKVDGEDIEINLENATGLYAQNGGKIDFRNGTIDMTGGSCNVALGMGKGENNEIVFSGGVINITGDLSGQHAQSDLKNFAIAIGSSAFSASNSLVIVNGGTINLKNEGGIAIAVGATGNYGIAAHVGDGVVINVQATGNGKACALASENMGNGLVGVLYNDAYLNIGDATNNFKLLSSSIGGGYFGNTGWNLYDGTVVHSFMKPISRKMSEDATGCQYTKEAMSLN